MAPFLVCVDELEGLSFVVDDCVDFGVAEPAGEGDGRVVSPHSRRNEAEAEVPGNSSTPTLIWQHDTPIVQVKNTINC